MPKRSITDEEIALIKAMLLRGTKNKDIQFFFNRPDRAVNSGRITGINNGSYSNSNDIPPASQSVLESYIKSFKTTGISGVVSIKGEEDDLSTNPLSQPLLLSKFEKHSDGHWYFSLSETDDHECKEGFSFKNQDKWLRPIGGLANNRGGYIFFGVRDKKVNDGIETDDSNRVVGLSNTDFLDADPADFTKHVRSIFDPTPRVLTTVVEFDEHKVGAMYIEQHSSRPVIATKGSGKIHEGDILFRYSGQSTRIKYSDLRTILDDRDTVSRTQILPMVAKLLQLGPEKAMIADLSKGLLSDEKKSIVIGEELLDHIQFIREGQFKESEGAPTLKMIGTVSPVSSLGETVLESYVTSSDVIEAFLDQTDLNNPLEYIRCAVEAGRSPWLPIFYFAKLANLKKVALVEFIDGIEAPPSFKEKYKKRALGKKLAYKKAGGAVEEICDTLIAEKALNPIDETYATQICLAISSFADKPDTELAQYLKTLNDCKDALAISKKSTRMSTFRRAIARIDELYFPL